MDKIIITNVENGRIVEKNQSLREAQEQLELFPFLKKRKIFMFKNPHKKIIHEDGVIDEG